MDWYSFAIGVLLTLGLATAIPAPHQTKVNLMKSLSVCPWTPMSTTLLLVSAAGVRMLKSWKEEQGQEEQ